MSTVINALVGDSAKDLNRIAKALERIAEALEEANRAETARNEYVNAGPN